MFDSTECKFIFTYLTSFVKNMTSISWFHFSDQMKMHLCLVYLKLFCYYFICSRKHNFLLLNFCGMYEACSYQKQILGVLISNIICYLNWLYQSIYNYSKSFQLFPPHERLQVFRLRASALGLISSMRYVNDRDTPD